jgi:hypothetical protein
LTLNVTLVSDRFIACASDRRLTTIDGKIVSERSMKLTAFATHSAYGFIAYNGIGCDQNGETPSDWLSNIPDIGTLTLKSLAERVRDIAEPRINTLKGAFRRIPKHTFVISAFELTTPVIGMISNYETLGDEPDAETARPSLDVQFRVPKPVTSGAVVATGDAGQSGGNRMRDLFAVLKSRKPVERITRLMVKTVRDSAFERECRGSVGTSVALGVWPMGGQCTTSSHVVGGTSVEEMPNFLSSRISVRDMWIQTKGPFVSRYNPRMARGAIAEMPCKECCNPVPEGYARCGVCGALTNIRI